MKSVGTIISEVKKLEGFDVHLICDELQKPFRSNKRLDFDFNYKRAASNKMTVSCWSRQRMPEDVEVVVLDADGNPMHGRTTLNTVRQTYV